RDWSSDVCSSDLQVLPVVLALLFQYCWKPRVVLGVYRHQGCSRRQRIAIELLRHPAVSPLRVVDDDEFRVRRANGGGQVAPAGVGYGFRFLAYNKVNLSHRLDAINVMA